MKWLERRELEGKRSADTDRSCWGKHVAGERFALGPMAAITKRDIRDWVRVLLRRKVTHATRTLTGTKTRTLNRTLARETVKHALNLVQLCIDEAVIDAPVPENPARSIKVPRQPQTKQTWTYLQLPEIDTVLRCEKIPLEYRLIYQFAIFGGLRRGEIFGLHWNDVLLDGEVPRVIVRFSWNRPTKAGKVRELPLLAPAVEALRTWRAMSKSTKLVFPAAHGGCHHRSYEAGWFDKKVRKRGTQPGWKSIAGITRHARFHDLRHTCGSHLVSGSWGRAWRIEEVRDYLGHTNITVTQRYAHLAQRPRLR